MQWYWIIAAVFVILLSLMHLSRILRFDTSLRLLRGVAKNGVSPGLKRLFLHASRLLCRQGGEVAGQIKSHAEQFFFSRWNRSSHRMRERKAKTQ